MVYWYLLEWRTAFLQVKYYMVSNTPIQKSQKRYSYFLYFLAKSVHHIFQHPLGCKDFFPGVSYGGSRCWAVPDFASLGATERFVGVESLRAGTELWNGRLAVGSFKQLGPTWSEESYGISDCLEFGLRKTHRNPKKTPKCFWGQQHVSPQIAVLYIVWLASDLLVYYIRL